VQKLTEEEYLAIERAAEFKSEFFNGEMFAMSGVSLGHARLQQNLSGELFNRLRGSGCEAFSSDLKVRIPRSGNYFYPDMFVICGEPLLSDDWKDIILNPAVVFE